MEAINFSYRFVPRGEKSFRDIYGKLAEEAASMGLTLLVDTETDEIRFVNPDDRNRWGDDSGKELPKQLKRSYGNDFLIIELTG